MPPDCQDQSAHKSSFGQLKEYLQESARDSTMTVSLLVNGYDSDPIRAQASQMEFASEMPYYHIDDAGLETLGIKYMPGVMVIGPDGLLDFIDDASDFYFWDLGYPFK
ncbi:MAG: hypothetical protein PHU99_00420 [Candidatus Cloacimonetes bacterium]|jgi:hypothetical protein|nr:hypothetical protein [Candidatus Cloacimonadota bacterium]MCK9333720.1 hypothetical protein [Candidatus Cloacimonadota bacterium]MDD3096171.1 hypothetical protein [Candidatus Cloacimonadota bacterium]MDD4033863.1 hypothetical protein [Candidatus Cloacimonadota bacterium]